MEQEKELISRENMVKIFAAFIIGGFPWWVWIKPLVSGNNEYYILIFQIPAFFYVVIMAWGILKKLRSHTIEIITKVYEAEKYLAASKHESDKASLLHEKADKKLQEAELIVLRAKKKYSTEETS